MMMRQDTDGNDDSSNSEQQQGTVSGPPTDCLNTTGSEVLINCDSHMCIEAFMDLVEDFDGTFGETCAPNGPSGFKVPTELEDLMSTLRQLSGCNQCVVKYTRFTRLAAHFAGTDCLPTTSTYSCDSDCTRELGTYLGLWEEMIRGVCGKNNPSGCGGMGGVTEGAIYDIIAPMYDDMSRLYTVIPFCSAGCGPAVTSWLDSWSPLVEASCLSSEDADLTQVNLMLGDYVFDQQCDADCKVMVDAVAAKYYAIPAPCRAGTLDAHASALVNSVNPSHCDDASGTWDLLGEMTMAKAFFTLTIL